MRLLHHIIGLGAIFLMLGLHAQQAMGQTDPDRKPIQFSGQVFTEHNDDLIAVPFVNIAIQGTSRGTFSDYDGFFSIVAREGETVVFSALGFETAKYEVPDDLWSDHYTIFQLLTQDTILLPETVIYPWPSRRHFDIEFLAMDVSNELQRRAAENLSDEALARLREDMPADGPEATSLYFRQQSQSYYHQGQFRPMNVLNPMAWKEFIDAWRDGQFRRQSD
ncbi:MAG: carboxypeptidase-like regulatory domain-containing protein [Saprospirales bacterium]|nr:MAG: carboxypeptidase-like regulatory domain-containing protein [Saprospirales bacterium]